MNLDLSFLNYYLAGGALYLIPLLIGRSLFRLKHLLKIWNRHHAPHQSTHYSTASQTTAVLYDSISDTITQAGMAFALGMLTLFGTALLFYQWAAAVYQIPTSLFFSVVWGVAGLELLVSICPLLKKLTRFKWKWLVTPPALDLLVIFFGSLLIMAVWNSHSPFLLNWDWYQHQLLATLIRQGQLNFFINKMSDTFGFLSYPPTTHLLIAISQFPWTPTPRFLLAYWQAVSWWHFLAITIASWSLTWVITRNRLVTLTTTLLNLLIFDSIITFTSLFFLPQTLCAILALIFLTQTLRAKHTLSAKGLLTQLPLILVAVLSLVLTHFIIGIAASALYLGFWYYHQFAEKFWQRRLHWILVGAGFLGLIGLVAASYHLDLGFINRGEAANYMFSLNEKFDYVRQIYGWSFFLLLPIGASLLLFKRKGITTLCLLILFGFLILLASHFPYILKFYVLAKFFVHLTMGVSLAGILSLIPNKSIRVFGLVLVSFGFFCQLIFNIYFWKYPLQRGGLYTHVSELDVTASEFLQKEYGDQNVLLLSDPATQFILEGLSGTNSPGGAFASHNNRELTYQALTASNSLKTEQLLENINDGISFSPTKRLLALSGRTFLWLSASEEQQASFNFNIWSPQYLTDQNSAYIQNLARNPHFFLLYSSPQLAIFEVKR